MAIDKAVDSSFLNTGLTSIANAIRTKGGTSAQLAFPSGFVSAVNAIPTGEGFNYVKTYKSNVDHYAFWSMKTEAMPEYVSFTLTDNNYSGWSLSGTVDFRDTSDDPVYLQIEDSNVTIYIDCSRTNYGIAANFSYSLDHGQTWHWYADSLIVEATVYSNQPIYTPITPSDGFWRTSGRNILDENKNLVQINGIAMAANDFNNDSQPDYPAIYQFSVSGATDASSPSLQEIASLGFNEIRLLFGYHLLEDDNNPGVYKQSGWNWLDAIEGWAEDNNIKIVLNLHSGQGGTQYSAEGIDMWLDSSYQTRIVNMWKAIANRYKNSHTFIGWELMNEMHLKLFNQSMASTFCIASSFIQRIINAIREVDANHMIFVDRCLQFYKDSDFNAFFGADKPSTYVNVDRCYIYYLALADSQLVCDYHFYQGRPTIDPETGVVTPGDTKEELALNMYNHTLFFARLYGENCPIYIGEYGVLWRYDEKDEDFIRWVRDVRDICIERGYQSNFHCYYGYFHGGTNSMGLRYVTTWRGDAMSGTLYTPLAEVLSSTIKRATGTFTTSSTTGKIGWYNVTDCGFKPDLVVIHVGSYTESGETYQFSFNFPFFMYNNLSDTNMIESNVINDDSSYVTIDALFGVPDSNGFHGSFGHYDHTYTFNAIPNATFEYVAYKWTP